MKLVVTAFMIFNSCCVYAQNMKIDSVKKVLSNSKDDSNKVKIFLTLSNMYQAGRDISNTILYAKEALKLAQHINFKKGEGDAFFKLGFLYTQTNNLTAAKENLYESTRIREESKSDNAGFNYMALARVYIIENNFPESMKLLLKALKFYENKGNKRMTALVYWRLSWIYMGYGDYQKALNYCSMSNDICIELNLKEQIAGNLSFMGLLNLELQNDSLATINITSSLMLANELNSREGTAMSNLCLSSLLLSQAEDSLEKNNYQAAIEKLLLAENKAMRAWDFLKNSEGAVYQYDIFPLAICYNVLGKINFHLKKFVIAMQYTKKANQLALRIRFTGEILKSYQNLSQLESAQGNYRLALANYKKYISFRDSISSITNTVKMETARLQYHFDIKEDSLHQQQLLTEVRLQSQKKQKFYSWIGLVLLGLLAFLGYKNFRNQKKLNRMADETHARERAELELHSLRAQLNPHFMFNSLNAIQELILLEEYEKSLSYLGRFAKLLRMLLENAEKSFISLQREMEFLTLYLSLEKLRVPDMEYTINIDPSINTEITGIPNMILQPYIENAIWHGISNKKGNKILYINITQHDGLVGYEIKDNGVGRKKSSELKSFFRKEHKSKGMELLSRRFKLLAKEYGSNIETIISDVITNNEVTGTIVKIEVPMNYTSAFKTV